MNPLLWIVDRFLRGWSAVQVWAGVQSAFPDVTAGRFARLHTAADTGIAHGLEQTVGGPDRIIPYGDLAVDSSIRRGRVQYNIRATWVDVVEEEGEVVEKHVYSTTLTIEARGTLTGERIAERVAELTGELDDIPYDVSGMEMHWRVESVFRGPAR